MRSRDWLTDHRRNAIAHRHLSILQDAGFVVLDPYVGVVDPAEWLKLDYLDWDLSARIRFAPLASADGDLNSDGFWASIPPRADKDGKWVESQRAVAPTLVNRVEQIAARHGRVRVIELQPNTYADVIYNMHRDPNNMLNPEGEGEGWVVRSFMQLTDNPDSLMVLRHDVADPSTEIRIALPVGAQLVIDSQRLWHSVWHVGNQPRYCMVTSVESGPALEEWILQRNPTTHVAQQILDSAFARHMEDEAQQRRAVRAAQSAAAVK